MSAERDTEPDMMWTVHNVAAFLQVSESWVYRAARADKIPHFYIGALLRFSPQQIRDYSQGRGTRAKVVSIKRGTMPVRTGRKDP